MLPVAVHVPEVGSYNSAVALPPPATRTFPSARSVAVSFVRPVVMLCVLDHVPLLGLKSSALSQLHPPATNTVPLRSKAAMCVVRPVLMLPVAVHTPVEGSYSSAVAVAVHPRANKC